jgi:hypothetical protein
VSIDFSWAWQSFIKSFYRVDNHLNFYVTRVWLKNLLIILWIVLIYNYFAVIYRSRLTEDLPNWSRSCSWSASWFPMPRSKSIVKWMRTFFCKFFCHPGTICVKLCTGCVCAGPVKRWGAWSRKGCRVNYAPFWLRCWWQPRPKKLTARNLRWWRAWPRDPASTALSASTASEKTPKAFISSLALTSSTNQ